MGQPARARPRRTRATPAATRWRSPRATAPSSSPSTTPAPSSASSACRSTWAGAPTRSPTCSATRGPAGIVVETPARRRDARRRCAKATGVADVIVPPAPARRTPPSPPTGSGSRWTTSTADDASQPEVHVDDRDPLTYLYTSGTTSFPKGVVGDATWRSTWSRCPRRWTPAGAPRDRFAAMMPMFHTAQLNAFCTPAVMVGATIHVHARLRPGSASSTRSSASGITQVFGLPMMYRAALEHPSFAGRDLSSPAARRVRDGPDARRADPRLPRRLRLRLRAAVRPDRDEPVHDAVPPRAPAHPHRRGRHPADRRPGRDHGRRTATLLPAGRAGRDRLPRPVDDERVPATTRRPPTTAFAHGWFHSGDVGHFGDDGVLWFADRYKDVIKTGGENVASIEVEKAVYAADPRRRRGRGRRAAARAVDRGDHRGRRAEAGRDRSTRRRCSPRMKAAPGRLQGPEGGDRRRRAAATSTGKIQKNVVRDAHADALRGGA